MSARGGTLSSPALSVTLRRELAFVSPDLRRLDGVESEVLALPFFSDLRPLRGAAGLVDWRMCGFLSKLLIRGRIDGSPGELTLLPSRERLSVDKILLVGLGASVDFSLKRFDDAVQRILEAATRARMRSCVLELPGRSTGAIAPADAMERFLESIRDFEELDELILVEGQMAQRAMEPVLERERRRTRARVG